MLRRTLVLSVDLARKIALVSGYLETNSSEFIRAAAEAEIEKHAANNAALAMLLDQDRP